jgi:hypothetical protein
MMHRALACPDLWDRVYLPHLIDVHGLLLFRRTCRQARDLPIAPLTLAKVFLPDVPKALLLRVCEAHPRLTPSCIAHAVKTILFPEVPHGARLCPRVIGWVGHILWLAKAKPPAG